MKLRSVLLLLTMAAASVFAQMDEAASKQEVGLTLGGLFNRSRSNGPTRLELGPGTALQANYGYRFFERANYAVYGEVHVLANPQRQVTSIDQTLTRDVATIFLTPGVRVKFRPRNKFAPYLAAGAGYAEFEQSDYRLDGKPNQASRELSRGVINVGAGVDMKFWRFVGLRAEVRDFYSASPAYNTNAIGGGQHNVVAGGGLLLRFK